MKTFSKAVVVCAALTCLPIANSQAATFEFGVITGTPGNNSRSWDNTVMGSFTDYARFSITGTSDLASSITNSYADTASFITDFTLSLYSGAIGSGTLVGTAVSSDANNPPGTQRVDFTWLAQAQGNYYLQVSGTTADRPSYGGSLGVSLSTVPLPASAPLFGAALMMVGAIGYGAKRKRNAVPA